MKKIYIPIGSNCEIAHYLRNKNIRFEAFPFDWNCASLKSVYELIKNNFEYFLDDCLIGKKIKRLYFFEDEKLIISDEYIYPVICKKYLILFPHDYNNIDYKNLYMIKEKYKRRIERFNNYIRMNDLKIIMVYNNLKFNLNDWQRSVYEDLKININDLQDSNYEYLQKIRDIYKDKNIAIISLDELKKIT